MTRSIKEPISLDDTPYYHLVSRCATFAVKTKSLAKTMGTGGAGSKTIVEFCRLFLQLRFVLTLCFQITFILSSRCFHKTLPPFSDQEVMRRSTSLYKGHSLIQKWKSGETLTQAECNVESDEMEKIRRHFFSPDISSVFKKGIKIFLFSKLNSSDC